MTLSTGEDKLSLAPVLRAAAVPLLDQNTCKSSEVNGGRNQPILDSMLCAGKLISCYTISCTILKSTFYCLGFLQGGIGLCFLSIVK